MRAWVHTENSVMSPLVQPRRPRVRTRRLRALVAATATATMMASIMMSTLPGTAATSNVVVAAQVPSATNLDASGCATGQANRTEFGTVMPGSSMVTGLDCSVLWGSSNDTATLRAYQSSGGLGSAMTKPPTTTTQTLSGSRTMDLEMATASVGWVVIESSGLDNLRTTSDGGATWTNVANPIAAPLKGLSVVSTTVAWMSEAWGNQVARTIDGTNWVATAPLPAAARVHDIEATSSTVAWATGYTTPATGGQIWKTIDGGATWTNPCNNCAGGEINDLYMVDATTGWAVTSWGSILKTVDGATFAVQTSFGGILYAVAAYDTTHAVAAG